MLQNFCRRPRHRVGPWIPLLEKVFRKHKRPVCDSWRMDETYIKVKGAWHYGLEVEVGPDPLDDLLSS